MGDDFYGERGCSRRKGNELGEGREGKRNACSTCIGEREWGIKGTLYMQRRGGLLQGSLRCFRYDTYVQHGQL